jgi:hypothetical protein
MVVFGRSNYCLDQQTIRTARRVTSVIKTHVPNKSHLVGTIYFVGATYTWGGGKGASNPRTFLKRLYPKMCFPAIYYLKKPNEQNWQFLQLKNVDHSC